MHTVTTRRAPTANTPFAPKLLVSATALALVALAASAQAQEVGQKGDVASWKTAEYQADWGLDSMKAAYAYAQGVTGKNVKVGVIDSGAALHSELTGERWHRLAVKGEYAADGERYPNNNGPVAENKKGRFSAGESFNVSADYEHGVSDSHGTHVAGTVGANRDGVGMHGVAFGSDVYLASTGGNDNMVYGENQDYAYFKAAYEAMAREGVKVVNQSWGSATSRDFGKSEYWKSLADFEKKGKTFVDAAAEVALEHDMIFVWTNGNNSNGNPYLRASLPYFRPELQDHWLTVAAGNDRSLEGFSGKAGIASWWTVTAPGKDVNSSFVNYDGDGSVGASDGTPAYKKYSGTSQAAPHATGALALVMERFDYMTPTQARDVLLTTATQTPGGSEFMKSPDANIGWGFVNLKEAMRGPRQIMGTLDVTMNARDDVWTHDIVEDGWNGSRFKNPNSLKEQDKKEDRLWTSRKRELEAKISGSSITPEEKAEYETGLRREAVRKARVAEGYAGKLVKRGNGTLTLTGENAFSGGLTIHEGTVAGLTNAFGSGKVVVADGGNLTVLKTVKWDELTDSGFEAKEKSYTGSTAVNVDVADGATLTLENGVNVGQLKFEGNGYLIASLTDEEKRAIRDGEALDWAFTMKGDWNNDTFVDTGLAFYEVKEVTAAAVQATSGKSSVVVGFAPADTSDFSTVARLRAAGNATLDTWSRQDALRTEDSLRDDFYAASQNLSLLHADRLMGAAFGRGNDRRESPLADGYRLWVDVTGVKGETSTRAGDADTQLRAGFFGVERAWAPDWTAGGYLAVGEEELKLGDSSVKGDVYHIGAYLGRNLGRADLRAAVGYTAIERKAGRFAGVANEFAHVKAESDLAIWQGAGEVRWRLYESERFAFTPIVKAGVVFLKDDGLTEKFGTHELNRTPKDRTVGFAKAGFDASERVADTLTLGLGVNVNTWFGDRNVTLSQSIDKGASVATKMTELESAAELALDVKWQPTKSTLVGVAYEGLFSDDTKEHGLRASVKYLF